MPLQRRMLAVKPLSNLPVELVKDDEGVRDVNNFLACFTIMNVMMRQRAEEKDRSNAERSSSAVGG